MFNSVIYRAEYMNNMGSLGKRDLVQYGAVGQAQFIA